MKKILSLLIIIVGGFGFFNTIVNQSNAVTTSEDIKNKTVQIGGQPFGIKFYSQGAMITKVRENSPADKGGLRKNDIIIEIDGKKIKTNDMVKEIIANSKGKELDFTINRDYEIINEKITPEYVNGKYTAGIWIKDSCAGIGTITYYDKGSNTFACLGHGICDKDSSTLLPMAEGDICPAIIESIEKGKSGSPGGLNGYFLDKEIGKAYKNSEYGVFCTQEVDTYYKEYKVAEKKDIENGQAYIYTTVEGDTPKMYEVNIHLTGILNFDRKKDIVIEITDNELLKKTGGIVQGMSGSPIIQGDKIVGAITHVFVNDPTRGYGILAETMIEKGE